MDGIHFASKTGGFSARKIHIIGCLNTSTKQWHSVFSSNPVDGEKPNERNKIPENQQ